MAKNVHLTSVTTENLSRQEMLAWVNRSLLSDFKKIEDMCTGAAYCQLVDSLFPGAIPMKRVKFCTNLEHDFLNNLKLFQQALVQLKVDKVILMFGKLQANP